MFVLRKDEVTTILNYLLVTVIISMISIWYLYFDEFYDHM